MALSKILVVDDNASFRQIVITMLGAVAGEYIECQDGREALASYGRHRPDLVLMDLEMKTVDGIQATRRIREEFPSAQVLIFSQHDDPDFRLAAEAAGACGYLIKDDLVALSRFVETQGSH